MRRKIHHKTTRDESLFARLADHITALARRLFGKVSALGNNLARTLRWLPVIWRDRDWDWVNILEILRHKIKLTRLHIEENGIHASKHRDVHNMHIAELLLGRLQDPHRYVEADWKAYRDRWGSVTEELEAADLPQDYLALRPMTDAQAKEVERLSKKEEERWQRDFDYLALHLKKHLRHFWD